MPNRRLWPATAGPSTTAADGQPVNLAVQIEVTEPCRATHLHFYRPDSTVTGLVTGHLCRSTGPGTGEIVEGSEVVFDLTGDPVGQWVTAALPPDVALVPGEKYKPTVRFPNAFPIEAGYWGVGGAGENGITQDFLHAANAASAVDGQGSYSVGAATVYPGSGSVNQANYGVDITVSNDFGGTMATHTAQPGDTAAHLTLTAATEMVVTFPADFDRVTVVNRTAGTEVFATFDNTAAAVDSPKSRVVLPGQPVTVEPPTGGPTIVRVISSGTPKVSIQEA